MMSQPVYYVNGEFTPAEHASLPLNDLGILRGYGVFDVLRTYDHTPFRLRDHVERLEESARQRDIELPWSTAELMALGEETNARNGFKNTNIRYIVTGGPSPNFMAPQGNPSLVIMATPVPPLDDSQYTDGCTATTAAVVRERPTVKSLNYIGAVMAVEEAKKVGAVEALYRNKRDEITEGTRANFFIFRDNQLITPADEVLDGITRRVVLELAPALFDVVQRPIHVSELADTDEAFITSTTKDLLPIVQIDDVVIGNGRPGPNTAKLLQIFQDYAHEQTVTA